MAAPNFSRPMIKFIFFSLIESQKKVSVTNFLNGWKVFRFRLTELFGNWSKTLIAVLISTDIFHPDKKPSRLWSRVWKRKLTGKKFGCWLESSVEVTQTQFNRICQSKIVSTFLFLEALLVVHTGLFTSSHVAPDEFSHWRQNLSALFSRTIAIDDIFSSSRNFFWRAGFKNISKILSEKSSNHSRQEMDRCRRWPWDEYRGNELELAAAQLVERNEMKTND